jgi:hypothetical protein
MNFIMSTEPDQTRVESASPPPNPVAFDIIKKEGRVLKSGTAADL